MDAAADRERFERALLSCLREALQPCTAASLHTMAQVCLRQSQVPRPAALEPMFWRHSALLLDGMAQPGADAKAFAGGDDTVLPVHFRHLVATLAAQALSLWRQGPCVPSGVQVALLQRVRDATCAPPCADSALTRADEVSLALCETLTRLDAAGLAHPASDILPRARALARELLELSVALPLQPLADLMELELCLLGADPLAHAAALADGALEARHALHRFAAGTPRDVDARVAALMRHAWEHAQRRADA